MYEKEKENMMYCKFIMDQRVISAFRPAPPKQQQQQRTVKPAPQPPRKKPTAPPRKMGGMLGSLLGKQSRTAHHLSVVRAPKKDNDNGTTTTSTSSSSAGSSPASLTSGAVIAKFRTEVEQKLLDFQSLPQETLLKYHYSLSATTALLDAEQRAKVTMETLKFLVYEQVEEIGEDKWVAVKEPGDFMDEHTIAIYKEGCAPAEVLEEMNKGDLPDEIRGQAKALQQQRMKQVQKKDLAIEKQNMQQLNKSVVVETLNTKKRDRRTIEEIQRDMMGGDAKRANLG
mmetsp:Transcript_27287/g.39518  ORF Transcript_27287/g.39518 Transcript_27287/m.39518 type:complete len:284 (+) Transcript_27287:1595-2446(+)